MKSSMIGSMMQRTFAKSLSGATVVMDDAEVMEDEEIWGPAHSFVSSPENDRAASMRWQSKNED